MTNQGLYVVVFTVEHSVNHRGRGEPAGSHVNYYLNHLLVVTASVVSDQPIFRTACGGLFIKLFFWLSHILLYPSLSAVPNQKSNASFQSSHLPYHLILTLTLTSLVAVGRTLSCKCSSKQKRDNGNGLHRDLEKCVGIGMWARQEMMGRVKSRDYLSSPALWPHS